MSRLRWRSALAGAGLNATPRRASGIERDDHEGVEDHRRQDRALGRRQAHDVERGELREDRDEDRRDDREVLGDVVGDRERRDRAPGDQELLPDRDDLEQLGGVGVEVDHVGRVLGRGRAAVHRHADVRLGEGRRVVGAVAGHRDQVALGLLGADEGDLVLRGGLRDEVVDAGLLGDRRRRPRVVAGDHHGLDAHAAEFGEPLDEAFLDGVLELDDAQDPALALEDQRRAAEVGDPVALLDDLGRQAADLGFDRIDGALQDGRARRRPDTARARLRAERDVLGDRRTEGGEAGVVPGAAGATQLGRGACGRGRRSTGPPGSRRGSRRPGRPSSPRRPRGRPGRP